MLLAKAEPGVVYEVSRVYERDRKRLEFLDERGIRATADLTLESRTLSLITGRGSCAIGIPAAETRVGVTC